MKSYKSIAAGNVQRNTQVIANICHPTEDTSLIACSGDELNQFLVNYLDADAKFDGFNNLESFADVFAACVEELGMNIDIYLA